MVEGYWYLYTLDGKYLGRYQQFNGINALALDEYGAKCISEGDFLLMEERLGNKRWEVRILKISRWRTMWKCRFRVLAHSSVIHDCKKDHKDLMNRLHPSLAQKILDIIKGKR